MIRPDLSARAVLLLAASLVASCDASSKSSGSSSAASTKGASTKGGSASSKTSTEAPKGSASTQAGESSFDKLTATIDGKPMHVEHAFVKGLPDGRRQLYLGEGGSCNELLTSLGDGKKVHMLVDLPSRLAPDGKETFGVKGLWFGPPTDADPGGTAAINGDIAKGSNVTIDLAFSGKGGRDEKLDVKGSFTAEGCGDQDTSQGPLPKAKHASTATMTIANKKLPIRAALRRGENIELSDFPRDCTAAWFIGARVRREQGSWLLDGERFAAESKGDAKGLAVKPGKTGSSDDGPTVELDVSGSGEIGQYAVALEGTVEALDCK